MSERLRNREVPFPQEEIIGNNQELENMVVTYVKTGKLLDYDSLPDTITSGGIDRYATWLAELTAKDPEHRERAASIHLTTGQDPFIYPANPNVGNYNRSEQVTTRNFQRFLPLIATHSHPNSTGPSFTDLKAPIADLDNIQRVLWRVNVIGSQEKNYLILVTEQSRIEDIDSALARMEGISKAHVEAVEAQFSFLDDEIEGIPEKERDVLNKLYMNCVIAAQIETFGAPFFDYYYSHATPFHIAESFKLGFYYSDKDGVYKKYTESMIQDIRDTMPQAQQLGNQMFMQIASNHSIDDIKQYFE